MGCGNVRQCLRETSRSHSAVGGLTTSVRKDSQPPEWGIVSHCRKVCCEGEVRVRYILEHLTPPPLFDEPLERKILGWCPEVKLSLVSTI